MDRRKSILIPISGGYQSATSLVIYTQNIIKGLNNIKEDNIKPYVILYHDNHTPIQDFLAINYLYLILFNSKKDVSFFKRAINYVSNKWYNKHFFKTYNNKVDFVFPAAINNDFVTYEKLIYWKADFQEKYLPHFFTKDDLKYSNLFFNILAENKNYLLLLSSQDAKNSFNKFYPNHTNPTFILKFTSLISAITNVNFTELKKDYGINKPYYIVCNQFWPHKNHLRVLEALNHLQSEDRDFQIVFTGNTSSYRNTTIINDIKYYIDNNQLNDNVIITGFIDREVQIELIKNAIAVVQPSYFEGWSTVIEDAKALNKYVMASNLDVHLEQLNEYCDFFNPDDADELSKLLQINKNKNFQVKINYQLEIDKFSQNLIKLFSLDD